MWLRFSNSAALARKIMHWTRLMAHYKFITSRSFKKLTINQLGLFLIEQPNRSSGLPLFHRLMLYYTTRLFPSLIALQNTSARGHGLSDTHTHTHTQWRATVLHWCKQNPLLSKLMSRFACAITSACTP